MSAYDPLNPTREAPSYKPEQCPVGRSTEWQLQGQTRDSDIWHSIGRPFTTKLSAEKERSDYQTYTGFAWRSYRIVRVETKTYVES